jgi:hypothetical protein
MNLSPHLCGPYSPRQPQIKFVKSMGFWYKRRRAGLGLFGLSFVFAGSSNLEASEGLAPFRSQTLGGICPT